MGSTTVVKDARIVNEGEIVEGDLAIRDGRIERVGGTIAGDTEIDAAGAWLMPGMIDDQVHFREPGFEHKATIGTESAAALAGGVTSYMEMPNCIPQTIDAGALEDKHRRAAAKSAANYAFYFGATNDNLEAIKAVDPLKACGVKVFMGASTGNMLVDDEETLEGIFASCPLVIATHCEDTPTILANEARAQAEYGDVIPLEMHPRIRSEEACYKSSSLAVELARRHGSRLHVLHLTTARELELFESGPVENKRITAEVCVHHLFFDETDYATRGADIKCNPAIKTPDDRRALRAAVLEDRIDVIATDHAPHTREGEGAPALRRRAVGHAAGAACVAEPARAHAGGNGRAQDRPRARSEIQRQGTRLPAGRLLGGPGVDRSGPAHAGRRRESLVQVRLVTVFRDDLWIPHYAHVSQRPPGVRKWRVTGYVSRDGAGV